MTFRGVVEEERIDMTRDLHCKNVLFNIPMLRATCLHVRHVLKIMYQVSAFLASRMKAYQKLYAHSHGHEHTDGLNSTIAPLIRSGDRCWIVP